MAKKKFNPSKARATRKAYKSPRWFAPKVTSKVRKRGK